MLRASMGQQLLGRPEKKNTKSKVTRVNQPRILRYLSQFSLQNSRIPTLGVVETYFHLMWMSPYIVSFGVVTCLVTSSMCMEVKKFRLTSTTAIEVRRFNLIFYNCHQKLTTQWEVIAMNKGFAHTSKQQNVA